MRPAAWALLALLWAAPAWAAQHTVIAEGMAPLVNGSPAQAGRQARADALRVAVEQVMGLRLESRVIIKNELLSSSRLAAFTRGGIKSYRVLSQGPRGNTFYCILEVTVTDQPQDMDCALCGLLGAPRLALRAPAALEPGAEAAARQAVSRVLANRKLTLLAGPHAADADITLRLEQVDITGGFDGAAEQARARVVLSALENSTGQVLASESAQGSALGRSRSQARDAAAAKAAHQAAGAIVGRLMGWWNHYLHQGLPLWVELEAPRGRDRDMERFFRALENLPGVNACQELERKEGRARWLARYLGPRSSLHEEIVSAWEDEPGGGKLRCKSSKGRVLVFSLM